MAVKTITIDLEAYELLRRHKSEGISFSQVIKQHFETPRTGRDLLSALKETGLATDTLEALDELVTRRANDKAEAPSL